LVLIDGHLFLPVMLDLMEIFIGLFVLELLNCLFFGGVLVFVVELGYWGKSERGLVF